MAVQLLGLLRVARVIFLEPLLGQVVKVGVLGTLLLTVGLLDKPL